MYNSNHYFKESISDYFSIIGETMLFSLMLFLPISLVTILMQASFFLSFIPLIMMVMYPVLKVVSIPYAEESYVRAQKKYKEEQLIAGFNSSPNYHFFVKERIDNSAGFISTMSNVVISLESIESMINENSGVARFIEDYSYYEESKRILLFILMNPELFEHYSVWAYDYVSELERLTANYLRLTQGDLRYVSDMSPKENREKIIEISEEVQNTFTQEDGIKVTTCIDEFLDELNYTLATNKN